MIGQARILARPRRRHTLLPFVLVLASLLALALLPLVTFRRTEAARRYADEVLQPARAQVTRIQTAIALESAALRGFQASGDPGGERLHRRAREDRSAAVAELRALRELVGIQTARAITRLLARIEDIEPDLDSLFARTAPTPTPANMASRNVALELVLASAVEVDRRLGDELNDVLMRVRVTSRTNVTLTIGFVLLALGAAVMVARLGRTVVASEERFRQLAESLHDFVWLSDVDLTHNVYANVAFEQIWHRSRDELYRDPRIILDAIHPDDRQRVLEAVRQLPRAGLSLEYRILRPDGDQRSLWTRAFPIANRRGEPYRVAAITEDITDRARAMESRTRLIRGFTHDVKNPLGAADGMLALLQEGMGGTLEEGQREYVHRARRSIRAALDLIQQLLDIARAEAGQLDVRRAPLNLAATIADLVEELRPRAIAKRQSLSVSYPDPDVVIESDHRRVRQIVANLLSNAVKYTPNGGAIEVITQLQSDSEPRRVDDGPGDAAASAYDASPPRGRWATVTVRDNGPGIPADKQSLLFREFTRFNPAATEGSGIGLAISQRIAHALDGTITFTSEEGRGSTFTLWLPA